MMNLFHAYFIGLKLYSYNYKSLKKGKIGSARSLHYILLKIYMKFQFEARILILWTKFAQKENFQSKHRKCTPP